MSLVGLQELERMLTNPKTSDTIKLQATKLIFEYAVAKPAQEIINTDGNRIDRIAELLQNPVNIDIAADVPPALRPLDPVKGLAQYHEEEPIKKAK
jgi:hypothetical protein